jgi:hypothetical protein
MIDLVSCIPIYCFVLCQNQMKLTYYCFLYGSMSMILRIFNQGPEPYETHELRPGRLKSFTQEYSCVKLLRVPEFKIRESITILYDRYFFETFLIMHNIEICPILVRDGTKNNPQEVEIPHSPLTAK